MHHRYGLLFLRAKLAALYFGLLLARVLERAIWEVLDLTSDPLLHSVVLVREI